MSDLKMGPVETRFAEIIWEKEPVGSMELVKLAEEALGWKKSTTYTVLKKLCEKGVLQNQDSTVSARARTLSIRLWGSSTCTRPPYCISQLTMPSLTAAEMVVSK